MSLPATNTQAAARAWLAAADPDPVHADRWLSKATIVLLPVGRKWDAVKTPIGAGRDVLDGGIEGPVICDPAGQSMFFLVPTSTVDDWDVLGTTCLSDACYLAVPVPAMLAPPGPHWVQPPDGSGQLVDPAALRDALTPRLGAEHFV